MQTGMLSGSYIVDICADLQAQLRQLCKQYENVTSPFESETCYLAIRGYNKGGFELTRFVVGSLSLQLQPMGWIHVVGKMLTHSFATYTISWMSLMIVIDFWLHPFPNCSITFPCLSLPYVGSHWVWAFWDAILQSCQNGPQQMASAIRQPG
jgi:hypothetical protein